MIISKDLEVLHKISLFSIKMKYQDSCASMDYMAYN
jgi:hypothetical protein